MTAASDDGRPPRFSRRRKWLPMLMTAAFGITCLGAVTGQTVYVDRISLPIRNGKFAFDKVLVTALHGDAMQVTGVEGRWLRVTYTPRSADPAKPAVPVQGYVLEDALTAIAPSVAATRSTGDAASLGAVGAAKGLLNAAAYAASQGLNSEPFWMMVTDARRSMNGADESFEEFEKAGGLGPFKPKTVFIPATQPKPAPVPIPATEPFRAPATGPATQPK